MILLADRHRKYLGLTEIYPSWLIVEVKEHIQTFWNGIALQPIS